MRITARRTKASSATSLREMTMISADRMRSVKIADFTSASSSFGSRSRAAASRAARSSGVSLSSLCEIFSHTFSMPSKHR